MDINKRAKKTRQVRPKLSEAVSLNDAEIAEVFNDRYSGGSAQMSA